ncbi:serine protease snake isoform X1 [Bicyclus anynana]|uniref:Serine protease snake isoform X1 n=1 Tax=Bicyclus anynana TaxID=110368 RepID=A0ABM3M4L8_BICAN|nr:serine protease snake isoform X1 [Bicyclus anynana]
MKWFALSVVFFGVVQNGSSLNEGEGCVIRHTDSAGVCTLGSKCLPALNDYQRNGIPPTLCSEQRFPFLVCCTDLTAINQKPVFEKTTRRKRLSERKCDEYSRYMPENTPNCIDDQVIEKAKRGEFPHMAAVGWENYLRRTDYMFECSGSLISSRFVLTSADCKVGPYSHKQPPKIVRLGPLDIPMQDNATDGDLPVKSIHVYPGYNSSVIYNNIALLELEADVDFNDDIRPACLWSKPDFPGYSKAIATGWVVDGIIAS